MLPRWGTFPTQKGRHVLANFFVYLTLACSAATAVFLAKATFTNVRQARTRLRVTAVATATGTVVCFVTALQLAGLMAV